MILTALGLVLLASLIDSILALAAMEVARACRAARRRPESPDEARRRIVRNLAWIDKHLIGCKRQPDDLKPDQWGV